jgi:hypothetical protein
MDAIASTGRIDTMLAQVTNWLPEMRRNSGPADRDAAFPTADLERLRDTGCLSAPLSVSLGGLGLGTEPAGSEGVSKLLRLLGRGNLSVALPLARQDYLQSSLSSPMAPDRTCHRDNSRRRLM